MKRKGEIGKKSQTELNLVKHYPNLKSLKNVRIDSKPLKFKEKLFKYSDEVLTWDLNNVSFHVSMLDNKSIIVKLDVCVSQICHSIFRKRSARYLKRDL